MAVSRFDITLKSLVEIGPQDRVSLAEAPPGPVQIIDADLAAVSRAADKVIRVAAAHPYLFHLEFQAGHDAAELPRKLNARGALLEERHDLAVRSVVVVQSPEADSPALTGRYQRAVGDEEPYRWFRYNVIRVWRLDPERLLEGGLATLPLAPVSAVTEAQVPGIIDRMRQRLERRTARRQAPELWTATYILLGVRYSDAVAQALIQGVQAMTESTTYQAILREGEARGAVAEARRWLTMQGEVRFGPPDRRTRKALDGIDDLSRLEALGVRLLHVKSWQELLAEQPAAAQPAPRRRRNRTEDT
jgi:predicted transposase YdaD